MREKLFAFEINAINVENDPASMLDILTIAEASKSLVYRSIGEEYPFQKFADTVFADVSDDPEIDIPKMLENFIAEMEEYFAGIEE